MNVLAGRFTVDDRSGCWNWDGYVSSNGYGRLQWEGAHRWVHRVSYILHKGPIPDRHDIDHTCENKRCVNPEHLDAVTRSEHVTRTVRRAGKESRQVRAAWLRSEGLTYAEIADELGFPGGKGSASTAVRMAVRKGLVPDGTVRTARKVTEEQYEEIRELRVQGLTNPQIAALYGIHSSHVSRICTGRKSRALIQGRVT